ncbi:RagB/SusD family nutrient uptake outer membrane protein [Draconibacterium sp. IB214405]|uniref:RagB/SusD family nutrient uptake outer membrane protein n=1 Tax=Draconibacterium sp. IB214405 TaxID=3097352 RepID=UPI002A0CE450|nr:RagB/SusD family nutrient uptake outer membrane protein [Draconibacterium sp. IB214405]MDX8339001.1 RagB/SusD family nutrient uptake outer membrane protein [Draconibacterium sp. IB214405]
MKLLISYFKPVFLSGMLLVAIIGCTDKLDQPFENESFTSDVDYTIAEDMDLPLLGAYYGFYTRAWEEPLTLGLRGDDVNAAGDQVPMQEQDNFTYMASHWNTNSVWQNHYNDIVNIFTAIDEINKYREATGNDALADQYIAECRVMRGYLYLNIARTFGGCIVIDALDNIQNTPLSKKAEVMQYIVDEMTDAIPNLPDMHPNKRSDIRGGMTTYTAYAIQALAYQEMKDYQGVVNATSQIINSGEFQLAGDYYHLFKTAGKLDDENIMEFQYSDFNQGEGDRFAFLWAPFGIGGWTPVVTGAGAGWGFYEPTLKYIEFMLDRGEVVRLETSVIFTPDGITELRNDYGELPEWITNTNREGDIFNNNARLNFASGKHIQPSTELIPGRTSLGSNKNFIVIRYSEMLLMYAEAITRGASSSISMSADDAVNMVRSRAGLGSLSGVTTQNVLDEKFAELAMEWGTRYYDMIRTENTSELSHEGKTFTMDKAYLPFPADQVAELPQLEVGID